MAKLEDRELAEKLQAAYGARSGWGGPSFYDQFHNAGDAIDELNRLNAAGQLKDDDQYNRYKALFSGQQGQAVAGGVIAGLGGLSSIATTAMGLGEINDTASYQNQIDRINRIGNQNYNSFDALSMDYARLGESQPNFSYQDVRGLTKGQIAGGIASSTLSGASAGLTIGGPWGAAIGGAIGLGAGVAGWLSGDDSARTEEQRLRTNAAMANENARLNLDAAGERLRDSQHRYNLQNVAREGGSLRKQETIEQFASRVLRKPRQKNASSSDRIVHQRCTGGTMIRFKK